MTPRRKARFEKRRFHKLEAVAKVFKTIFDIDVLKGIDSADVKFEVCLFHRRQIYEHKGGEADHFHSENAAATIC